VPEINLTRTIPVAVRISLLVVLAVLLLALGVGSAIAVEKTQLAGRSPHNACIFADDRA
jgi:hypothetical protein